MTLQLGNVAVAELVARIALAYEIELPAQAAGLNFIRLATPTTDANRLPRVLQNTSGFVYYVSITGITGAAQAQAGDVGPEVARISCSRVAMSRSSAGPPDRAAAIS